MIVRCTAKMLKRDGTDADRDGAESLGRREERARLRVGGDDGAPVIRVETDAADGNVAYEAHMVKAEDTPVTVYVDKSLAVVSVESR